nr:MAG TPA: hypothetical protein [Caudoviricetes sp.]
MAKTYICFVNNEFQAATAQNFKAPDNEEFRDTGVFKHPVFQMIHAVSKEVNEPLKIVLINLCNESVKETFKDELLENANHGLTLTVLDGNINDGRDTIDLCLKVLDALEDNDEVTVCTAYGNKITDRVVQTALHSAYRLMDNVSIQAIIDVKGSSDGAELRDMTALFQLDEIATLLRDRKFGSVHALKMIVSPDDLTDDNEEEA